jgi:hypothetical protein
MGQHNHSAGLNRTEIGRKACANAGRKHNRASQCLDAQGRFRRRRHQALKRVHERIGRLVAGLQNPIGFAIKRFALLGDSLHGFEGVIGAVQ